MQIGRYRKMKTDGHQIASQGGEHQKVETSELGHIYEQHII